MEKVDVLDVTASILTNLPSKKERKPFLKNGLIIFCSILLLLIGFIFYQEKN